MTYQFSYHSAPGQERPCGHRGTTRVIKFELLDTLDPYQSGTSPGEQYNLNFPVNSSVSEVKKVIFGIFKN